MVNLQTSFKLEKSKPCLLLTTVIVLQPKQFLTDKSTEIRRQEGVFPFRYSDSQIKERRLYSLQHLWKGSHLHISTSTGSVLQFPATNFLLKMPPSQSVHGGQGTAGWGQQPSKRERAELNENQKHPPKGASFIQDNTAIRAETRSKPHSLSQK